MAGVIFTYIISFFLLQTLPRIYDICERFYFRNSMQRAEEAYSVNCMRETMKVLKIM